MQWGELRGVRVEGQLFGPATALEVREADGAVVKRTAHYANPSTLTRDGDVQRVTVQIGGWETNQAVCSVGERSARIDVSAQLSAKLAPGSGESLWLALSLPRGAAGSGVEWMDRETSGPAPTVRARGLRWAGPDGGFSFMAAGVREFVLDATSPAVPGGGAQVRVLLAGAGETVATSFTLEVSGPIDHSPVEVQIDPGRPGRRFDGIGGNFRLQFPESDPAIIDYNLAHLRVAWARVAMWWKDWDGQGPADPLAAARVGRVTDRQRRQIAMAQRLAAAGIPVIVSVWDPPAWAIRAGPRAPGAYTDSIDPAAWNRAAATVADFLLFLKESAGVEAALFSCNEPDLGLVPTPDEHIGFTKELGRAFRARGLATRVLIADTSNATLSSLAFADAARSDPEARSYIGAVGFHTWGGCEPDNLVRWDQTARGLGLPLLVTEAGPDAEAHKHPALFLESAYALDEAALYVSVCALAQPTALLEWQLTADYSVLRGGGAYGQTGALAPTLRFRTLQQLGETPAGAFSLPVRSPRADVVAAAFGDLTHGRYVIHLVNTGARRDVTLAGLPAGTGSVRVITSDAAHGRHETRQPRGEGSVRVDLAPASMTSVWVEPATP